MKNFRLFSLLTALFLGTGAVVATEQYGWQSTYYIQNTPDGSSCTPVQTNCSEEGDAVCRTTYEDEDGADGPELFLLEGTPQKCTRAMYRPTQGMD